MLPLLILFNEPSPDPAELLEKVKTAYIGLSSYSDAGECTVTGSGIKEHLRFNTHFQRPSRLYFEYTQRDGEKMVIWPGKNGQYQTWWTIQPKVNLSSLDMAIAGATGVSHSTAHTIPHLLMPKLGADLFTVVSDLKYVGVAEQDRAKCDRVTFSSVLNSKLTVWIDSKTHLIRRIEHTVTIDPKTMKEMMERAGGEVAPGSLPQQPLTFSTITIYRPKANPKLLPSQFTFVPPR